MHDNMHDEQEEIKQEKPDRGFYEWVQALVCSVLTVVLIFTFGVRLIGVDGHSMVPTLQHGDRLLVTTSLLNSSYRYGDIVILRKESFADGEPIVKRVIATGGQTVDIDFATGSVYVDGVLLDEPYIAELTFTQEGMAFPLTVPEGSIFVMGDNRNGSNDSRDTKLGTVDTRCVIGKVVFLLFPGADAYTKEREFSRIGPIHGTEELAVDLTRLQREQA
jgi:signal peptidase I